MIIVSLLLIYYSYTFDKLLIATYLVYISNCIYSISYSITPHSLNYSFAFYNLFSKFTFSIFHFASFFMFSFILFYHLSFNSFVLLLSLLLSNYILYISYTNSLLYYYYSFNFSNKFLWMSFTKCFINTYTYYSVSINNYYNHYVLLLLLNFKRTFIH